MQTESIAYQSAINFGKRIVLLSKHLRQEHQEFTLSRQVLRSGTSIGANIAEARCGFSRKDFTAKIYVALKECVETQYWLELLLAGEYLTSAEHQSLSDDCEQLRRMLSATTRSLR